VSLRKMSEILPDVMAEITRLIDARQREKQASARESVQARRARNAHDLLVENRPDDPRKRVGCGRAGKQLELGLTIIK